ncbi:hypothetical protein ONZ45_g8851 [Pleurotus djamor]|nr:hypothetical protein ONZ45_g8851 [Pleurotus djamor]
MGECSLVALSVDACLELFDIRPNLRPSAQQLLSIIAANAPILENFVLSISTPRLKTLRLDDSCVPIVASLIIPSTVSFDIVDRTGAAIAADSLRQIEGLARSLTPAARFTSAKVIVGSLLELYAEGPRQQRLRLGGYQPTFWVQNGANALHFFPLENLTELILCGFEEQHTAVNGAKALLESRKEWQTMLISGLIELRVLTIRGGLPALLLETLLERTMLCKGISGEARTHYVSPSGVGKLLLPKLARIEFFNCNFDIGLLGLETKPVDMLVAILWARQQHNDLVPTVHFQGSGTIESWELEKLRRLTKVSRGPYEEAWGIADGPQDHHAMAMDALEQLVLLFQGSESVVR